MYNILISKLVNSKIFTLISSLLFLNFFWAFPLATLGVGLVPGFASLPCFTALRLRYFHHQSDHIVALVPVRTGFAALHIPNAKNLRFLLSFRYWVLDRKDRTLHSVRFYYIKMGIWVIYPKKIPNTSEPNKEHKIDPSLDNQTPDSICNKIV